MTATISSTPTKPPITAIQRIAEDFAKMAAERLPAGRRTLDGTEEKRQPETPPPAEKGVRRSAAVHRT
jgi:hypothetical protein